MTANDRVGEPPESDCQDNSPTEESQLQEADIEEYHALSREMDEINKCLDVLEKKNDNLHEELFKLLVESRQIHSELKEAHSSSS